MSCSRDGGRARVAVSDNGIGIAPELLERIFEAFVQERPRSDGTGGLGLGLALARQLVELHDGTISVHSAGRDAGSRFDVELPAVQVVSAVAAVHATESAERAIAAP